MQLKQGDKHMNRDSVPQAETSIKNISKALAAASCSALAAVAAPAMADGTAGEWDFDVATLYYSESDSRVMAIEPVFSATRNYDEGESLNLKAVFDVLTGASPNGATPSDSVQTFTRPSGSGSYDVAAGEAPLDDTFKDTRVALSATWAAPLNSDWAYSSGVYASNEYDYFSLGVNGGITRYLNQKNTTLNFGMSLENDWIEPVGTVPLGLSEMPHQSSPTYDADREASRESADDSKTIVDLLFGVTQVIDRSTLMQFNYGISLAEGYLNDPYKLLSVIDDTAGPGYGTNLQDANGNNIYIYEQRPDSRVKHSLYWQVKHALDSGDIVDASYRFMFDDWGITSHTLEASYQWRWDGAYLEPHVRYYQQSEADFYQRFVDASDYNSGAPNFKEASADYRLGELTSYTVGAKFGWMMAGGNEANVRVDYMLQSNDGDQGYGALASQDLYPDTDALILTFGYSF